MFIVSSYFLTICLRSTCKTVPQCILLLVCRYAPWVQILFWCIQCMSRTYFTFTCPFGAFTAQGQWWESLEALDRDRKLAVLREMQATDANLKVPSKFPHAIWCNLTHLGVQMIVDCPGCWDDNNCGLKVPAPAKGLDWKPCRFILFLLLHPLAVLPLLCHGCKQLLNGCSRGIPTATVCWLPASGLYMNVMALLPATCAVLLLLQTHFVV